MTDPVLSISDACAYLGIDDQAQGRVADNLAGIIAAAVAVLEGRIGPLLARPVTETLPGCCRNLLLSTPPLLSVTSLAGTSAVDVSTLTTLRWGLIAYADTATAFYDGSYTVTYQAGWAATVDDIPADLMLALKELVRHLWQPFRGAPNRNPSATAPETNLTSFALPNRVLQLLAPYEWGAVS